MITAGRRNRYSHQIKRNNAASFLFTSCGTIVVAIYFWTWLVRTRFESQTIHFASGNNAEASSLSAPIINQIDENQQHHQEVTRNSAHRAASVDYMACCGAGHRLSKMAEANYLAKRMGFSLRTFWRYCDDDEKNIQTEVFHYLFGTQPAQDVIVNVTMENMYARINNDVPGFKKLIRTGDPHNCTQCNLDKAATDVIFYTDLRQRFRNRENVDKFRKQFLGWNESANGSHETTTTTVIGMHIRAGNGETGDFSSRGRTISNEDEWLQNLTSLVIQESQKQNWKSASSSQNNLVLFLATDTPSMIERIRNLLSPANIPVVHLDQARPQEGTGVLFGEQGKVVRDGEKCLRGWEATISDMILLSYADVVIAARPSSFTQSMPMSLVLSRPKQSRKVAKPFCEVNGVATEMKCYSDFQEWCCNGITEFSLQGIQRYDYLRMPGVDLPQTFDMNDPDLRRRFKIRERPEEGCIPKPGGVKQICLPYDWSSFVVKPRQPFDAYSPRFIPRGQRMVA